MTRGKAAAAKALELDDRLASAHYALATAHTWYDWDWQNAEREFRRALELDPDDALGRNWHGGYLSLRRRHEEAIAEHERARDLDPRSLIVNANLARALYWARRYDEAIAQARRTLEFGPALRDRAVLARRFASSPGPLQGSRGVETTGVHAGTGADHRAHFRAPTASRRSCGECGAAYREQRVARDGRPVLRADWRHRGSPRAARGLLPPSLLRAGQRDGGTGLRRAAISSRDSSSLLRKVDPDGMEGHR